MKLSIALLLLVTLGLAGCSHRQQNEKSDQAARQAGHAAYQASHDLEKAAKQLDRKIQQAGRQAQQGWNDAKREDETKKQDRQ